ncbi:MAG TPA: nucleotidyltransferase domain-containing protein [Roseiarcus sp.]|nr:nucleotidyltransferase domain-containing protein [Roseiarcus sp.]
MRDPLLERLTPALAAAPGVLAVALGGSRARGVATASSDYDIGLYYGRAPLDTKRLLEIVRSLVDDPVAASVTEVGGWGPWIVGGGWLSIGRQKVDLIYRSGAAVREVIRACQAGEVTMDYQPGHPHGFCSAIWMGEAALCQPLHDPQGILAELKAMCSPYPDLLQKALIQRFQWEVLFSIENGETAVARGEQTHMAGCAYRALCCIGQVLFALNRRYLINEKGALDEAAKFPLTIPGLSDLTANIWRAIGSREFDDALAILRICERALKVLTMAAV